MSNKIKIVKREKQCFVYYKYDNTFIDIMRENGGWWRRNEKAWTFPVGQASEIYNRLKEEGFKVDLLKEKKKKTKKKKQKPSTINPSFEEHFKDPDVIMVWHKCKKCGNKKFVSEEKVCTECSMHS
jgi:hypothetical protein